MMPIDVEVNTLADRMRYLLARVISRTGEMNGQERINSSSVGLMEMAVLLFRMGQDDDSNSTLCPYGTGYWSNHDCSGTLL